MPKYLTKEQMDVMESNEIDFTKLSVMERITILENAQRVAPFAKKEEYSDQLYEQRTYAYNLMKSTPYIGNAVARASDVAFSFLTMKLLGVLGAALMLTSPFGVGVGAVLMVLSLGAAVTNTYTYIRDHQSVNKVRDERAIIEDIQDELKELEEHKKKHPELADIIDARINITQDSSKSIAFKNVNPLDSALTIFRDNGVNDIASLGLAIASLNIFSMAFKTFSLIGSYSAFTYMRHDFVQSVSDAKSYNNIIRSNCGINKNMSRDELVNLLDDLYKMNRLISNHDKKYIGTNEIDTHKFNDVLNNNKNAILNKRDVSFFNSTKDIFRNGYSWSFLGMELTATLQKTEVKDHYGKERFEKIVAAKEKEREIDISKERGIEKTEKIEISSDIQKKPLISRVSQNEKPQPKEEITKRDPLEKGDAKQRH